MHRTVALESFIPTGVTYLIHGLGRTAHRVSRQACSVPKVAISKKALKVRTPMGSGRGPAETAIVCCTTTYCAKDRFKIVLRLAIPFGPRKMVSGKTADTNEIILYLTILTFENQLVRSCSRYLIANNFL